jgi:hypothetical protein
MLVVRYVQALCKSCSAANGGSGRGLEESALANNFTFEATIAASQR